MGMGTLVWGSGYGSGMGTVGDGDKSSPRAARQCKTLECRCVRVTSLSGWWPEPDDRGPGSSEDARRTRKTREVASEAGSRESRHVQTASQLWRYVRIDILFRTHRNCYRRCYWHMRHWCDIESESEFSYSVLLINNHLLICYRHRQSGSTAYRLQARPAPMGPGLRLTAMLALICRLTHLLWRKNV